MNKLSLNSSSEFIISAQSLAESYRLQMAAIRQNLDDVLTNNGILKDTALKTEEIQRNLVSKLTEELDICKVKLNNLIEKETRCDNEINRLNYALKGIENLNGAL